MSGAGAGHAERDLHDLQQRIGHRFADQALLETALCHSSFAHESGDEQSNERLEFLGDAVIALVVGDLLFRAHADWREGDLTRGLHGLVDRRALSGLARRLDLGRYLRLGRTERRSRGNEKDSILADAMEAVIGALYLDGGLDVVRDFARREFGDSLRKGAVPVARDPKTRFQELVMARLGEFPRYALIVDSAVEGDERRFTVEALVQGEAWSRGVGRTKRAAEFAAATAALEKLLQQDGDG